VVGDTKADANHENQVDVANLDPTDRLLNQGTTVQPGANAKQYTPIDKYKPAGIIYNPDIFEKLEKKITFQGGNRSVS
jgi:hypothetical protein